MELATAESERSNGDSRIRSVRSTTSPNQTPPSERAGQIRALDTYPQLHHAPELELVAAERDSGRLQALRAPELELVAAERRRQARTGQGHGALLDPLAPPAPDPHPPPLISPVLHDHGGAPATHPTCDPMDAFPFCNPVGPPYDPPCYQTVEQGSYYYFHGNQMAESPNVGDTAWHAFPWRSIGKVTGTGGAGTCFYIGATSGNVRWFLTAAHVIHDFGWPGWVSVSLARQGECAPYGIVPIDAAWVPAEWAAATADTIDSPDVRAHDWALLRASLDFESYWIPGAPPPPPIAAKWVPTSAWQHLTPYTAGYACDRNADPGFPSPFPGTCRLDKTAYRTTAEQATVIALQSAPGGGGLLRLTVEGAGGMSGGPVWVQAQTPAEVEALGGFFHVVGVAVGSPCTGASSSENWAAGLTENVIARIGAIRTQGSHPDMIGSSFWQDLGEGVYGLEGFGGVTPGACPDF